MIPGLREPQHRRPMVPMPSMPDHYAQKPKAKYVRDVILRQIQAARSAVRRVGAENIELLASRRLGYPLERALSLSGPFGLC